MYKIWFSESEQLYRAFLDSVQNHQSTGQVFDTVANFAQNCSNVLDIMRENYLKGNKSKFFGFIKVSFNCFDEVFEIALVRRAAKQCDMLNTFTYSVFECLRKVLYVFWFYLIFGWEWVVKFKTWLGKGFHELSRQDSHFGQEVSFF